MPGERSKRSIIVLNSRDRPFSGRFKETSSPCGWESRRLAWDGGRSGHRSQAHVAKSSGTTWLSVGLSPFHIEDVELVYKPKEDLEGV